MKKILIFFLFFSALNAENLLQITEFDNNLEPKLELVESKVDKYEHYDKIFEVVNNIIEINSDLRILKAKIYDNNSTAYQENFSYLNSKKERLLRLLPSILMKESEEESKTILSSLDKEIKTLKNKITKFEKSKRNKNFEYFSDKNQLKNSEATEIFYKSLFNLRSLFLEKARRSEISNFLRENILELQKVTYDKSFENLAYLKEENKEDLRVDIKDSEEILVKSYEEILAYLLDNANIFADNLLVKSFKLQDMINYVNKDLKLENSYFNAGKLTAILFMTLFLFLFRKLIYLFTSFLMLKTIFIRNQDELEINSVVDTIKNPLGMILLTLNVDLCLTIFYSPHPFPSLFLSTIEILYIICFTWFFIALIQIYGMIFISKLIEKGGKKEILALGLKFIKFIIITLAILLILNKLGFDPTALIASLGIGGLAIAFASKDLLSNFFTSIVIIFNNAFSEGDWVKIGGYEGNIVEVGLKNTVLRSFDNSLVFLPNSQLINQSIENWTRRKAGRKIDFKIHFTYNSKREAILKFTEDVKAMLIANKDILTPNEKNVHKTFFIARHDLSSIDNLTGYKNTLFVHLSDLGESALEVRVYCFAKKTNLLAYYKVREDILIKTLELAEANNLELANFSNFVEIKSLPENFRK